jgi:hypothetical protein
VTFTPADTTDYTAATGSAKITVVGAVSLSQSTIAVSKSPIAAGGTATVTLTARDANGDQEPGGGLNVVFMLSGTSGGRIGAVTNNKNGTYTATFTAGTKTGTDTISAMIGRRRVTSKLTVNVVPGAVSASKSTIALSTSSSITSGGKITVTLTVRDANGNREPSGLNVIFGLGSSTGGTALETCGTPTCNKNGTYTATFTASIAGKNTITATIDGQAVTSKLPAVTVHPGAVSLSQSTITLLPSIVSGGTTMVTLVARDANGNRESGGGLKVKFALAAGSAGGTLSAVKDNKNGTYTATFTATAAGSDTITATIGGQPVTSTLPTVTVAPAAASSTAPASLGAATSNGLAIDAALRALLLDDATVTGEPHPLFGP